MVYYINSLDETGSETTNKKATNYEEFEAELLKKPQIRKEYEALKPKYDMIRSLHRT